MAVEGAPEGTPFIHRASTRIVAPFLAAGLAVGGLTIARNQNVAPETPPVAGSTANPGENKTPAYEVHGRLFKPENIGWQGFGGFDIDMRMDDGRQVGFTEPQQGPKDLYNQLLLMIIHQSNGKYGKTLSQIEQYLRTHNGIIPNFVYPSLTDLRAKYRSPSHVKPSKPMALDLSKPILLERSVLPPTPDSQIILGDTSLWTSTSVVDGQLIFTESNNYPLTEYTLGSVSRRFFTSLEATAGIKKAASYPLQKPYDFLSTIIDKVDLRTYRRNETVINGRVFAQADEAFTRFTYTLLGPSKK